MYIYSMQSNELLKGTLSTMILKLLKDNERMYGYEITQEIKQRTDGEITIKEGSLYPALHKLEKKELFNLNLKTSESEFVNITL